MSVRGMVVRPMWVACAMVVGLLAAPAAATADQPSDGPVRYVNMGDSYSAASGVLPPAPGSAPACTQSARNWAHDLAAEHGYELTDVSCGGAQTKDFSTPQFPGVPPQLDALSSSTQLVTMTIGGNDENVFINAITACSTAAARTAGQGSPCRDTYGDSFRHTIETKTFPHLLAALGKVRLHAPNARVAISGYLQILPPTRGCYPIMPVATGDVPYLDDIEASLNKAVRRAAAATGATFIDESRVSAGHDACRPLGVRWVEPAVGSVNYVPVHPNAAGEQAMADQAEAVLRR